MSTLYEDLKNAINGEVRFDPINKQVYSVDASIYEIEPIGIVLPKHKQDILNAVHIANQHHVPIIPRGAATGITGGCLGHGLIIDTSKYLNHILEINIEKGFALCEPGVIQDQLNDELGKHGYRLGPDTSTGNRATLGGMVANNSAGARSLKFGCMATHVDEVELVLASGEIFSFSSIDEQQWQSKRDLPNEEGTIYRTLFDIKQTYKDEIKKQFPPIPRRVSGYNLNELISNAPLNVSKLIVGSEGTLGIATQIKVKICPQIPASALCIIHFDDLIHAMHQIPSILQYKPISFEMIDRNIIEMGRLSPTMKTKLGWLSGDPDVVFAVEFEGITLKEAEQKAIDFSQEMMRRKIGYATNCLSDPVAASHVWDVRKAGLTLLLSKRGYQRAIAFIEDVSVAPDKLPAFMEDFCSYLKNQGKTAGIYGHAGSGCMHIRPYMDMRKSDELRLMETIMLDVSDLLLKHQGALSGEHGDGLTRSWLTKKMFGSKIYDAFVELKKAFDPHNRMNPGKIVHPAPFLQNLRLSPTTAIREPATFLDFSKEGGLSLAADLCNGNGLCRKREKTMCPSFQATDDEFHSTRARAQTLRAIIHGKLPIQELSGEGLHAVLDLCLQCKGCKTECPSQVDMAKMKAEALYHYHKEHGYSLRDRLLANVRTFNEWLSFAAPLFNGLIQTKAASFFQKFLGIASERTLPLLSKERFSHWYKREEAMKSDKKVVLFSDTFTEFHSPEIGQAAVRVLNALGYEVIVFANGCCGRPLISKGMLKQAQKKAANLVQSLTPFIKQNLPIIGLEPSCLLTMRDDFQGLLPGTTLPCFTFDEFIASHIKDGVLHLPFNSPKQKILVHGHCHQKALVGMEPTLAVLRAIPNASVMEIPSGCCGMAGAFGYEAEHYEISMKIGELHLLPTIRKSEPNSIIVANGFSCRHQITHGTDRESLHLAQVLSF